MPESVIIPNVVPVALVQGRSFFIDKLVKEVSKKTKTELDWYRPENNAVVYCSDEVSNKLHIAEVICELAKKKGRQPQMVKVVSSYFDFGDVETKL